jgi:hypothetical protein
VILFYRGLFWIWVKFGKPNKRKEIIMLSSPLMLQMPSSMTDDQFFEFCQLNRDLRIEKNRFGDIGLLFEF